MFQYVFTIVQKVCKPKFKTQVEQVGYSKHNNECRTWPAEALHIATIDRINSCKYSDISLSQYCLMINDKILYFKQVICEFLNIFN